MVVRDTRGASTPTTVAEGEATVVVATIEGAPSTLDAETTGGVPSTVVMITRGASPAANNTRASAKERSVSSVAVSKSGREPAEPAESPEKPDTMSCPHDATSTTTTAEVAGVDIMSTADGTTLETGAGCRTSTAARAGEAGTAGVVGWSQGTRTPQDPPRRRGPPVQSPKGVAKLG
jgi:hypothetical protein